MERGVKRTRIFETTAVDPETGRSCRVTFEHQKLADVARRSKGQVLEASRVVREILQRPYAIFEGLRRDDDEPRGHAFGWRCYCGIPSRAYSRDGAPMEPRPDRVFLVFVTDEGVAYNWRWEPCSDDDPNLPVDYRERFRSRRI